MLNKSLLLAAICGWLVGGVALGCLLLDYLHPAPRATILRTFPLEVASRERANPQVDLSKATTLGRFVDALAKAFAAPIQVVDSGTQAALDQPVHFSMATLDAQTAFRLANSQVTGLGILDYRVRDQHVEVAPAYYFAQLERVTVNYDITALVHDIRAAAPGQFTPNETETVRTIISLITSLVTPDDWRDNGGEVATITTMGSGLLVTAPPTAQLQIQALLAEFGRTPGWKTGADRVSEAVSSLTAGRGSAQTDSPCFR